MVHLTKKKDKGSSDEQKNTGLNISALSKNQRRKSLLGSSVLAALYNNNNKKAVFTAKDD